MIDNPVLQRTLPLESLNWLRGIASFLVCIFHFKLFVWKDETSNVILSFCNYGHNGVIIFFIISGFVIPYSMYVKNYSLKCFFKYILKRSIRIEPPYIIAILLMFLWGWYARTKIWQTPFEIDWSQFLLNITYLAPFTKAGWINVIFWTLAIEFQFYILTGLIFNLLMKGAGYKYSLFVIMLAIGFVVPEQYQTIFNFYIYFIIGFQSFLFFVKKITALEFIISMIGALSFVYFFKNGGAVPFAIFAVAGIFLLNYKWQVASFFGNISYSLYLTHGLIGGNIVLFTHELPRSFLFGVMLFNAICFAWIFYYVVERRFLIFSKKIRY